MTETAVANPTYLENIRHFFESRDIQCMRGIGIDLGTYEGVRSHAMRIYFRTNDGTMPPQGDRKWNEARVKTFYNWMRNGFPRGDAKPGPLPPISPRATRIRRNVTELEEPEVNKLKDAFRALMAKDGEDPESYFSLAGLHWLPGPDYYCRHHENAYNPWHRIYLLRFEEALRRVPGCEDVTLPYWDITDPKIPEIFDQEPFASYKIPQELRTLSGLVYPKDSSISRNSNSDILARLDSRGVTDNIEKAMGYSHWERFNGWDAGRTQDGIIRAHDNGHVACGETLANQDIAAFEPLFWFFHCNWDRLWWKWQQHYEATTLERFRSHLPGSAAWLEDPVLNALPPFPEVASETIDLTAFGVDYEHPEAEAAAKALGSRLGSLSAARSFAVDSEQRVSVRVKGIDRLQIPGSFEVSLSRGGQVIATQGFFQSTSPKHCATCRKNAIVNFDFELDRSQVEGGRLEVSVHRLGGFMGGQFPLSSCGNPTLNIRLLLDT